MRDDTGETFPVTEVAAAPASEDEDGDAAPGRLEGTGESERDWRPPLRADASLELSDVGQNKAWLCCDHI